MLEMLHCFYYNIFISDKLQDVYRCLLIFNLYNGVAGCLWLLSAKELYNILGEILALLKSLAKLLLISLGPRLNPSESIVYWLFSYCDFFFFLSDWNVFIYPNVKSAVAIWIFLQNLQDTTQVGIYASLNVQTFFIVLVLEYV